MDPAHMLLSLAPTETRDDELEAQATGYIVWIQGFQVTLVYIRRNPTENLWSLASGWCSWIDRLLPVDLRGESTCYRELER